MSGILTDMSLPSVDTVVYNSHILFTEHCDMSCNKIVQCTMHMSTVCYIHLLSLVFFYLYVYSVCVLLQWTFV